MRPPEPQQVGDIFEDIADAATDVADAVGEAFEDIGDALGDAADVIGSVLKAVAPLLAFVPGIGTALSVAITAAAAVAMGDPLDQALIDIASNAMPGPIAKAAFDSAADVTQAALRGEDVGAAALRACRQAAISAGGPRAGEAFDVGVAVARGEPIGDATWALARDSVAQAGPAALAAFDAGVALKNGGDVGDAALAITRAYLESTGNKLAIVAFDAGVALAQGAELQAAGFVALKSFAKGNNAAERAIVFAEKMAQAAREGKSLVRVFVDELDTEVGRFALSSVQSAMGDMLEGWIPEFDDYGSFELAERFGVPEAIARAAQAVMRDGEVDVPLLDRLTKGGVQTAIDKFGARVVASKALNQSYTSTAKHGAAAAVEKYGAAVVASKALNQSYGDTASAIREEQLMLVARMSADALSFRAARAEAGRPLAVDVVQASQSQTPRTGIGGDIALAGTVTAAVVALAWWWKSR